MGVWYWPPPSQVYQGFNMVKELITIEMERDSLQQKWGFTVQGGKDVSLTAKIASVKRFSPADRAGLEKMDYIWTVNGKEVFNMSQPQITKEIVGSQLKMVLQVERGTFIMRILPPAKKTEVEGLISSNAMTMDLYEILGKCTWTQPK